MSQAILLGKRSALLAGAAVRKLRNNREPSPQVNWRRRPAAFPDSGIHEEKVGRRTVHGDRYTELAA